MPEAVHDREEQDRAVLPEERIRQDRADDRKRIDRGDEYVKPGLGLLVAHHVELAIRAHQVLGHENDQNGTHPVVAVPLGGLVRDDVGDSRRHPVARFRGRAVTGCVGHQCDPSGFFLYQRLSETRPLHEPSPLFFTEMLVEATLIGTRRGSALPRGCTGGERDEERRPESAQPGLGRDAVSGICEWACDGLGCLGSDHEFHSD